MASLNAGHSKEIGEKLYAEQIRLLYSRSVTRPALHLISLSILVAVVINHVNTVYILTWALLLIGINVYRLVDINRTQESHI